MGWLDGLRAKVLGTPPGVFLGAFGKHPGWDDHIEPIGLDSEALLAVRDILYVRGIGGIVDAALWEKKPEETLPGIAHVFSWNGESDTLIGRMWSSADGKGRARYPMVAVAHMGVPFSYTLAVRAGEVLNRVEARCRQATTAPEVRSVFAEGLEALRASLAQPPDALGGEPDRAACTRLADAMWLQEGETFVRTLYALGDLARSSAHFAKSSSGKISLKMLETNVPTQQIRLPMDPADSVGGIAFWQKVINHYCPMKQALLFLHPVGQHWVDLICGTPTPQTLACLRANETALPQASAVPYTLDPAFRQSAGEFIGQICDFSALGKPDGVTAGAATPAQPPALPPPL